MSKLANLIHTLCPDGVAYKRLDEIFNTRNGYTPSKKEYSFWNGDTSIPWFRMEDIRTNGRILYDSIQHVTSEAVKGELFPENSIIVATSATIGEHALLKVKSLANQRFTYLMLKEEYKECFDLEFLYFYCFELDKWCLSHLNQGNFASVDMKQFVKFMFPVPPIEVQKEVVKELKTFSELINTLEQELSARQRQFEYYSYHLFEKAKKHQTVTLTEVCNIEKGKTPIQKAEQGVYPLVVTTTERKTCNTYQIDGEAVCIPLVSSRGHGVASLNHVYYQKGQFALGNILCAVSPKTESINCKYLYYYFEQTKNYTLVPLMKGGANVSLHVSDIAKLKIPLPALEEQERIVQVLSTFDKLSNDSFGVLTKEIELRKKQFEYYRDKLLSFKELK